MSGTSTRNGVACRIGRCFLSLGGIGFLPRYSPTIATAVAVALLWAFGHALPQDPYMRFGAILSLFAAVFIASLLALWHCVPSDDYDQRYVVIDEFLGMLVALFPALLFSLASPPFFFIAFVVFRVFDHRKPLGIRRIDAHNTPWSVLLDDVVAGVYTALVLAVTSEALSLTALKVLAPGAA